MAQIYVDNIVFGATSHKLVDHFVQHMSHEFEMSLIGELTYFLGLRVKQMNNGTFISQAKYARIQVKKFGLEFATHQRTHIGTHEKISHDEGGNGVDQALYRSIIGSLLYLTANRPNLCYNERICVRYQVFPKESHLVVVKKIIKYVSENNDMVLL